MKTVFRNLVSILRRFKMATVLNILGLSVAFAAFMIIMKQINYDYTFDKSHADHEKIFRIELVSPDGIQGIINRPLAELFFDSSPHIVAGAITTPWGREDLFTVEKDGVRQTYEEQMIPVAKEFTEVITFDIIEGTKDALKTPDNILIPLSIARKLFGNESAVGKQIVGRFVTLTVGGVYADFPANTIFKNKMYVAISDEENKTNWDNWNYQVYFRVDDPANVPQLMDNFKSSFDPKAIWGEEFSWETSGMDFRFTPLADIHFVTDVAYDPTPKSSKQTLLVLFAIAIVIVIIAGINFTNFSTALTPMRIKSINTQKVLGGDEDTIRMSLILEAIFIALLSYVLALGLVYLFSRTSLAGLVNADLSLQTDPMIIGGTAAIALLTGLLASLYPSYYMTSFPPALVLKGSFGLSPKGRSMRNVLISVQFIASFALIIGASFMYIQNYFMQNSPLGYEKDQLIITNMVQTINKSRDAFTNQLKSFSGIEDVTYAQALLSSQDQYMGWSRYYKGKSIAYQCLPVDYSFLNALGIEVKEGRSFREEDKNTRHGAYVFNEKAREMYELELGTMIDSATIVGFIPDVKFASFRTEVVPMAFYVWGTESWGSQPYFAYIKVKGGSDMRAAMDHVRTTLASFDPEYTFNVRFFDSVIQRLYEKENSLSILITLFSLIAIFISMVGVFGLVVFDSEYRRKEIGIRKVMGSTTQQIILLFNKTYVRILCICFVLAAPVAYYVVMRWLENFAYKTPIHWWVFLVSFLIVGLITVATVTFQNYWAANENPVDSIKTE